MKQWTKPDLYEINLSDTNYGGKTVSTFDNLYVNADGNWEATFNVEESVEVKPNTNHVS